MDSQLLGLNGSGEEGSHFMTPRVPLQGRVHFHGHTSWIRNRWHSTGNSPLGREVYRTRAMVCHAMLGSSNGRVLPDTVSRQGRPRARALHCTPTCATNPKRRGEQNVQRSRLSPPPAEIPANRPEGSKPDNSPVSTSAQSDSATSAVGHQGFRLGAYLLLLPDVPMFFPRTAAGP